jgi:hypothetical protein
MGNIHYMSPTWAILHEMEFVIEKMLKDLELLRLEHAALKAQHPSLTERDCGELK